MNQTKFILKGDICYSEDLTTLRCVTNGFLVCENGISQGVFESIPERYAAFPVMDRSSKLIIPGLADLHFHAPQFAFRGLGMDSQLLEWLNSYAFPEEARYNDLGYAREAYAAVVRDLQNGPNTRVCIYATIHVPATLLLMDLLEESGLVCMVGKVNMDRNSPDYLREESVEQAVRDIRLWLDRSAGRYENTSPILTPRFIPACSDELMYELKVLQKEYQLPVQSHLSESRAEIEWVRQLRPNDPSYGAAYESFGLFGGDVPTIMAHCCWSDDEEMELISRQKVYVAHCPQSNMNLSSGIAPVRCFLERGVQVGLGSDVAGGCHTSIFRAMSDAIQVSKLRFVYTDKAAQPLTVKEVFFLGTKGGGSFFGKVGSFESGYEFDALIIDDRELNTLTIHNNMEDRLSRVIYLSDNSHIAEKYVKGKKISSN